jgi:hypothetical protein
LITTSTCHRGGGGGCNGQEQVIIINKKRWHIGEDMELPGHQHSKKRFITHQNKTTTMKTSTKILISMTTLFL